MDRLDALQALAAGDDPPDAVVWAPPGAAVSIGMPWRIRHSAVGWDGVWFESRCVVVLALQTARGTLVGLRREPEPT